MVLRKTFHVPPIKVRESWYDPHLDILLPMIPNYFWFCGVALTFQGVSSRTTIVISARGEVRHDWPKLKKTSKPTRVCKLKILDFPQPPFWSAFAFRGGGAVTFQDIQFQTNSSAVAAHQFQAVVTVWDLAKLKIKSCTFRLVFPNSAVAVFYSKNTEGFTVHLETDDFYSTFIIDPLCRKIESYPLVFIKFLRHTTSNTEEVYPETLKRASSVVVKGNTFSLQVYW